MCPTCDVLPAAKGDVVQVPIGTNGTNGVHTINEKRGSSTRLNAPRTSQQRNPYAPRASDFLSNVSNFNIIESTLRGFYHLLYPPLPISLKI